MHYNMYADSTTEKKFPLKRLNRFCQTNTQRYRCVFKSILRYYLRENISWSWLKIA